MTEALEVEVMVDKWKIKRRTFPEQNERHQFVSCLILLINIETLVSVGTSVALIHFFHTMTWLIFFFFLLNHIMLIIWLRSRESHPSVPVRLTTGIGAAWEIKISSLGLVWISQKTPLRCLCSQISSLQTLWTQNGKKHEIQQICSPILGQIQQTKIKAVKSAFTWMSNNNLYNLYLHMWLHYWVGLLLSTFLWPHIFQY